MRWRSRRGEIGELDGDVAENPSRSRVRAVAFDVLETLLDLAPSHDRLERIGQPRELLQPWFMRFQRDLVEVVDGLLRFA